MLHRHIANVRIILLALCCQLSIVSPVTAEESPVEVSSQAAPVEELQQGQQLTVQSFSIARFIVTGSTLFSDQDMQGQLLRFAGRNRTPADLEEARYALENFFHAQGYPAVTVSLPEPLPRGKVVRLVVNENRATAGAAVPVSASAESPAKPEETPVPEEPVKPAEQDQQTFVIRNFVIEGTALFTADELQQQLRQFVGRGKSAADVEGARDVLERFFHDQGYPTVMVNIPEQSVQSKVIRLEVIENRVGTVTLTGNTWFTTDSIMADLPSIAPGQVIKLQELQQQINRLNRNPDLKVIPDMQPGKSPESVDLTLKVEDRLPLHGNLEINNRSSHDTTETRLLGSLHYDNLWQRGHSLSGQYQTSPEKWNEIQVASGSYTLPAPWDNEDKLVLYGVWSNSDTTSVGAFKTVGKGIIVGSRVILPLKSMIDSSHTAILGFDYKNFEDTAGLTGSNGVKTPIRYMPFSASYNGMLRDDGGVTSFNAGVNLSFRGLVSSERQFEDKRFKARGNYIFMTAGVERNQKLPADFTLLGRLDGQLSDQPLIANEQFTGGGVESVRGYRESEATGDNAIRGTLELAAPDLLKEVGKERYTLAPYLFYDFASLWLKDPLPGQVGEATLQGTGIGLRGLLFGSVDYQTDLGFALKETTRTSIGGTRVHFKVRWQF